VRFCDWGPHVVAASLVVGGLSAAAAAAEQTNNQTLFLCLTDDQMSSKAWEAVLAVEYVETNIGPQWAEAVYNPRAERGGWTNQVNALYHHPPGALEGSESRHLESRSNAAARLDFEGSASAAGNRNSRPIPLKTNASPNATRCCTTA
jgi:hypothetical protein